MKLTPQMVRHLTNAARNASGHYASNISQGGGTAGALLSRGLIEYRTGESVNERNGYYLTAAGRSAAAQEA